MLKTTKMILVLILAILTSSCTYDLLILSPETLRSNTGDGEIPRQIKEFKQRQQDLRVDLKYLEQDVYSTSTPGDEAAKIKRYIYDHTIKHRTRYVIVLGDADVFPVRYVPFYITMEKSERILSNLYARISSLAETAVDASWEDGDPGRHLNWAETMPNAELLPELKDRITRVFNRLHNKAGTRAHLYEVNTYAAKRLVCKGSTEGSPANCRVAV